MSLVLKAPGRALVWCAALLWSRQLWEGKELLCCRFLFPEEPGSRDISGCLCLWTQPVLCHGDGARNLFGFPHHCRSPGGSGLMDGALEMLWDQVHLPCPSPANSLCPQAGDYFCLHLKAQTLLSVRTFVQHFCHPPPLSVSERGCRWACPASLCSSRAQLS